jgi:hypothetical protein
MGRGLVVVFMARDKSYAKFEAVNFFIISILKPFYLV